MKISETLSDATVLTELGERLLHWRLAQNVTQAILAEEAGVSKRTVERIESGQSAQLSSLIKIMRAMQLLEHFDKLVPEPLPSPIEQLKMRRKTRVRASTRGITETPEEWSWGKDT